MKRVMGVQLETGLLVAPHAGAWIETTHGLRRTNADKRSPPTRGRGLKRYAHQW